MLSYYGATYLCASGCQPQCACVACRRYLWTASGALSIVHSPLCQICAFCASLRVRCMLEGAILRCPSCPLPPLPDFLFLRPSLCCQTFFLVATEPLRCMPRACTLPLLFPSCVCERPAMCAARALPRGALQRGGAPLPATRPSGRVNCICLQSSLYISHMQPGRGPAAAGRVVAHGRQQPWRVGPTRGLGADT